MVHHAQLVHCHAGHAMSASLVGSEMCIRDRGQAVGHGDALARYAES